MPAMLFDVGDWVSSIPTSVAALQEDFSHKSETSSSVGPSWPPAFDSEGGKQSSISMLGEVVTGPDEVIPT